jgi:dihydroorotate dehydrogenase (NAD+) catalytic subunit
MVDLSVQLGRLRLRNPVLIASGTGGYGRELAEYVDWQQLGGLIPKTVTRQPRLGNTPPRTVETACGLLNAIGLDNDGWEHFWEHHWPYLQKLPTAVIVNIAGKSEEEFVAMAADVAARGASVAAVELNLSCPNVSGGLDFATDAERTRRIIARCRAVCPHIPLIAKLTPQVTDITAIAAAAAEGGADAVSAVNTYLGMAIDWRQRRPRLGNITGGLSGPAIKPLALRAVWSIACRRIIPVIGIGGIASLDDVMEFLVAGAAAVQIGTANFYDPGVTMRLVHDLPAAIAQLGANRVSEIIGTLQVPKLR